MKDKTTSIETSAMWAQLFSSPTVDSYLAKAGNGYELPPFSDYINELCRIKNESPEKVIKRACIERSYGHRLFKGSRNPSRDTVLQLAFGFELSTDETQQLLKIARMSALHPKVKRDAIIAHCLYNGIGIVEAQQLLLDHNLPLLGGVSCE